MPLFWRFLSLASFFELSGADVEEVVVSDGFTLVETLTGGGGADAIRSA
jgi:hypothetical protein